MLTVLVTGCRSGIGLQTALAFARRGDRVYAGVRDPAAAVELRGCIAREQLPITVVGFDVTDRDAIARVTTAMVANEGRVDAVVNNAGIGGAASAIEEIDEEVARAVWETNFWAPFRLIRAVLPTMRAQGSGVIVNLSTVGVNVSSGPVLATYSISKMALTRLTQSLQAELVGTGIRAVSIEPGFFATEIYSGDKRRPIDPSSPYHELVEAVDTRIASGLAAGGDPADVAAAILAAVDDPDTPLSVLVGPDAIDAVDAYRRALVQDWGFGAVG